MLQKARKGLSFEARILRIVAVATLCTAGVGSAGDCPPIDGDNSDNVLTGTSCGEVIRARGGDDVVRAKAGDDNVDGGKGEDEIWGEQGNDLLNGGNDPDLVDGGPGDDEVKGFGGNDRLFGGEGNDVLKGESDDDFLDGGAGDDTLLGGSGDDYLDDAAGRNVLNGMSERDTVVGRTGQGTLMGGRQDDFLIVVGHTVEGYDSVNGDIEAFHNGSDLLFFARDANPEMVSVHPPTGHLQISFELRTQQSVSLNLADVEKIEAVATGDGDDRLIGTDFSSSFSYTDRLDISVHELFFSHGGNDFIETGGGSDFVDAGAGDDTIHLGNGAHHLIGGPGDDTFTWNAQALAGRKISLIEDLSAGDVVQWQGNWTVDDVSLEAIQIDDAPATRVSLRDVPKLDLEGVEPGDVRTRQARQGVELDVIRSIPRERAIGKGRIPLVSGNR